jgi:hypothetical protein
MHLRRIVMLIPPDPNNQREMELWTTIAVVGAMSRLTSYGFVVLMLAGLALVGYFVLLAVWDGLARLAVIYRRHAFSSTRNARILQISGGVLVLLLAIAYVLYRDNDTFAWGLILFSNALFVFVVVAELVNWQATRQRTAPMMPQNISLQNVVAWQKQVGQSNRPPTP